MIFLHTQTDRQHDFHPVWDMIHQTSLAQHSFHVASKTEAISVKTLDSTMFTWSGKQENSPWWRQKLTLFSKQECSLLKLVIWIGHSADQNYNFLAEKKNPIVWIGHSADQKQNRKTHYMDRIADQK